MAQVIFDGGNASGPSVKTIQLTSDTCEQVLNLVSQQLQDETNTTWAITPKMLPYLNLGLRELISLKPEAFTTIINTPLKPGPRQALPPGAIFLVDVESVVDLNGNPASNALLVDRVLMDKLVPNWYTYSGTDTIQYVIKDQRNPFYFYVFPPPPVSTVQSVALACSCYPAEIDSLLQIDGVTPTLFPLDNSYIAAIVNYVIYRCLGEETTIPNAQMKSQAFLQNFYKCIGVTIASKAKSDSQGA